MTGFVKEALAGMARLLWAQRLAVAIAMAPVVLFAFTIGTYYGYYYDNKFFNLLSLELWEDFRVYIYLGSHYHVPSALYSYLVYPLFFVFGPGDVAMEVSAVFFHVLTVLLCLKLGARFHGRAVGLVFGLLVAFAPIQIIQVYTIPDLSFAIFLNIAAFYLFLTGLELRCRRRVAAAAVVYSLVCFQAIYYILLLPFFALYCLAMLFRRPAGASVARPGKAAGLTGRLLGMASVALLLPGIAYIVLLCGVTLGGGYNGTLVAAAAAVPAALAFTYFRRAEPGRVWFAISFLVVSASLLAYYDLILQVDYHKLGRTFEYALNAAPAGGYDGRPAARFMGREVFIGGTRIYMSVLTSILEFAGKDFAKVSALNAEGLLRLYNDYFLLSYPRVIRLLAYAGAFFVLAGAAASFRKKEAGSYLYLWPLVWLFVVLLPFVNLGPSYFNIRRIYLAPVPYLFAALGVVGIASAVARPLALAGPLKARKRALVAGLCLVIALAASAGQGAFLKKNIYDRYWQDKSTDMYYKLFYGHYYGRSYKELGAFLLKDAPLKKDGRYRSMLVYTIPEDSRVGRSLPLFNTVNWYTQNQIEVEFDFKGASSALYGTEELLKGYLERLFSESPALETIYFADFVDTVNGFSYFSRVHPSITPYRVVDDDGINAFDAVLYRFDRADWRDEFTRRH